MEKVANCTVLESNLDQSETIEPPETSRTEEIVTPPARENTCVDVDYIDELDELFGVSLDDDNAALLKNLTINDVPIDGKSPDMSSESVVHESDYEGLLTERSDFIAELEKVVSQSDADAEDNAGGATCVLDVLDDGAAVGETDETDTEESHIDVKRHTPDAGVLGYTTKTCSELQLSTWHSTLVTECDSATTSTTTSGVTSENTTVSEPEPRCDERMSSGKKSVVKFYDDEDRESDEEDRNASRLALESREAMFRRAMTLLQARCRPTSMKQGAETADYQVPFGINLPKYIFIRQERPVPMEPLKAWRGYHGNVYFEPIQVNPLKSPQLSDAGESPKDSGRLPSKQAPRKVEPEKSLVKAGPDNRSDSRQTVKSSGSAPAHRPTARQMAILDKQAVINRFNESLHEDIIWLEGQENTGSLAIRPRTQPNGDRKRDLLYNKERICKGSVAHKLYVEKNASSKRPRFAVSGGKFTPPNSMSPLLRTQTQYSLSSQRLTTNSPDLYHMSDSKLPALDQIKSSLKHSAGPREKTYKRPLTVTTEMKPFVKYSPDVVAKFAQQAM